METEFIERDFKRKVCDQLRLASEGQDRFCVFTPFLFDDGDHISIILKKDQDGWLLSDEGHTFMHLSYDIDERDLQQGTRQRIIGNALLAFSIEDHDGELMIRIKDEQYGDALYNFVQGILKIADVTFLSRERVRSTFLEDFRSFLSARVAEERRTFDWTHPEYDPEGKYMVDCRINNVTRPLFVYALSNDDKVRDATIAILKFESWQISFRALAIFEDQEIITRRVLARFTDVCDKQFSSLASNHDRIAQYMESETSG